MSNKVYIEPHDWINKKFQISFPYVSLQVDFDDVNHPEVDAAVETIKEIVEAHWDENLFKQKLKFFVMKQREKYNLQNDYESVEEYLKMYGF